MKNSLLKYQIISAGSMTGTTAITSAVTGIQYLDNIGIQLNWTGTPNGGAVVQGSVDYAQDSLGNVTSTGNWVTLTSSSNVSANASATGAAGSYLYEVRTSVPWIRLVYTNTSSTGTLNAFICGKAV